MNIGLRLSSFMLLQVGDCFGKSLESYGCFQILCKLGSEPCLDDASWKIDKDYAILCINNYKPTK